MEFAFTQEQEELRRQARAFLEANPDAPLAELRELGWLGVSVPEERGGGGLSFVDEAILFEEAGRALYAGPFLTTAVVLPALPEVGRARPGRLELDGLVPHLDSADQVLREDMTDGRRPRARRSRPSTRRGRSAGSRADDGDAARRRLRAACGCGCSPRSRPRPSGSRRRRSSSASPTSPSASSSARRSAPTRPSRTRSPTPTSRPSSRARSPTGPPGAWPRRTSGRRVAVAAAKALCAETAVAACERSIQVHGGIGFTWEHVLHRYYKRAQWIDAFGGHAAKQRARRRRRAPRLRRSRCPSRKRKCSS